MLRVCAILVGFLLLLTGLISSNYSQAEESTLPEWVSNIFVWYAQGQVSESELLGAIEWLIENNVIKVKQVSENGDWKEQASKLYKENQQLEGDIAVLEKDVKYWKKKYEVYHQNLLDLSDRFGEYLDEVDQETQDSYPKTTLDDQTVTWEFYDSLDNFYVWTLPIESYESYIRATEPRDTVRLKMYDGDTVIVRDHTKFVRESFKDVIEEVYDSAGGDEEFIYSVWYIVSQLTTYSTDIGEDPRWAVETFTRGGGDCEDLAILIADMIKSSKHSKNWDIQFVYFDMDNPSRAKDVNHVAVTVDTGSLFYFIEPTAKTLDELNYWNEKGITGWYFDV